MPQQGISKGLSYVNDWDKDIERLYQQEEYAAGVRIRKQQDAQFYADQLKKGHGSTPYVEGKLDAFYKEKTKKIADWAIANPGFRTDVGLLEQWNDMTGELLNNNILQQDLQVKANFEKLQAAVSSKQISQAHYEREMKKYNDYAYADPSTDATPYVFENPKTIDITSLVADAQSIVKPIRTYERKGNLQVMKEGINPASSLAAARMIYSDEDNKIPIDKAYNEMLERDPNARTLFATPEEYMANLIEAGNKVRVIGEEYDAAYLRSIQTGKEDPVGLYFMRNEYEKIRDLKDGETASGSSYALALTAFGGREAIVASPSDGILVTSKSSGGYKPLDANTKMEAINFKSYKNIGGKLYGEVDVKMGTAIIQGGKKIPDVQNKLGEKYKSVADSVLMDWNFVAVDDSGTSPEDRFLGGNLGSEYTGTVLVPIKLEPSTLADYDGQFGTASDVKESSAFYSDPRNFNEIQQNEYNRRKEYVTGKIKENSISGVSYLKEVTDPKLIKQIGNGYVYVTMDGKETDENGNPYIMNMEGEVKTLYLK